MGIRRVGNAVNGVSALRGRVEGGCHCGGEGRRWGINVRRGGKRGGARGGSNRG